jgi:hypothetical protein
MQKPCLSWRLHNGNGSEIPLTLLIHTQQETGPSSLKRLNTTSQHSKGMKEEEWKEIGRWEI